MPLPTFGKETDAAWAAATPDEKREATVRAKWILGNTTHYVHGRSYESEDCMRLAAELIRFRKEGHQ